MHSNYKSVCQRVLAFIFVQSIHDNPYNRYNLKKILGYSFLGCCLLLILFLFTLNSINTRSCFYLRRGINAILINNTDNYIDRVVFGRNDCYNSNLSLSDIYPNSVRSGHKFLRLDGIAMFYYDSNLISRFIPVGYLWGSPNQIYLLIVEINEINSEGRITSYNVFNMDNTSRFQLLRMSMSLCNYN